MEYETCPYCGDENPAGARACACGYRFEGYAEREMRVMDEAAERIGQQRRRSHLIGGGLIATGLLLSVASLVASESAGGGRFLVFTGLIATGVAVLLKRPSY